MEAQGILVTHSDIASLVSSTLSLLSSGSQSEPIAFSYLSRHPAT